MNHPMIVATATAVPPHHYSQEELAAAAVRLLPETDSDGRRRALTRFFERVGVRERYLALPAERYGELGGIGERLTVWLDVALDLGERAVNGVLAEAKIDPLSVTGLVTSTVTGI